MIDDIGDTVGLIKDGQIKMRDELKYQNEKLLPDIDKGIDKNMNKTQKSNAAVMKLLNSRSNFSLYMIIAAEVVLLILQLLILP